ncbi:MULTISPECIES: hypothetical protein [unclassified Lentimicrobium]|uniref:hypothetical protein n=1 Tax=unclassified Lentimicrobium TaxID=2677434 RepID=UPI0015527282|nr:MULTISPECIES: hypothetical protein [unclassified Lentimicrobium]NPD46044.1 hypothetical protein [Lentimicrobium sp. S6]NPD84948.1 hypothetical protein [Lentimicrobium sp. L6]
MNKLYFKLLMYSLALLILSMYSCDKEENLIELIKGSYNIKYASVGGEDLTGYLINDSVSLTNLVVGQDGGSYLFYMYFQSYDRHFVYSSRYSFLNDEKLSITNTTSESGMPMIIYENIAFLPFSKQEKIVFNLEKLTENQLVLNTFYSGKTYRYEFEE